jgi:hypothetical protein
MTRFFSNEIEKALFSRKKSSDTDKVPEDQGNQLKTQVTKKIIA